jgi:antibiotic biosynthesis monooxygenase (ABM) superfamily enzyme
MVIYEVNLEINKEIYTDYMKWLKQHIQLMLQFKGFISAKVSHLTEINPHIKHVTIWYSLESKQALEQYLTLHAPTMRQEGIEKFGNKFSAHRRIFESIESFSR